MFAYEFRGLRDMKKLGQISLFIASLLVFPTLSFAEWQKLTSNVKASHYIHIESIRKTDGYVYYWGLTDLVEPLENTGALSVKSYNQADCERFRINRLNVSFHKEPLGRGNAETYSPEPKWLYANPDSSLEDILKFLCNFVK